MHKSLDRLTRFLARFRYPVSLPEDVTETLGVQVSNFLSFDELIKKVASSRCNPLSLAKYMPRKDAERAFQRATCIERFGEKTLVSYFFPEGWVEFILKFDRQSRLRRIYLLHKGIEDEGGIEISLCCSYIGNRPRKRAQVKHALSQGVMAR
ncbi:MAG: hypothetical protein VX777_02230 [Chlamydiota bacterium]|nr:hypothetical protein [Chlamydiota bacterium]